MMTSLAIWMAKRLGYGGDVPTTGFHACPGAFKFIDHNCQRSIDREILAELKEIRRLLEAAIDENFHIVQNDR